MTTQANKIVQANYSETLTVSIVAEYQALIISHNGDNSAVLKLLSEKYGKTVPSIRAKLSSLKVYVTTTTNTPAAGNKGMTKEAMANAISSLVGRDLVGLEVSPKATLQLLYDFVRAQADKIDQLINDLTEEGLYSSDS